MFADFENDTEALQSAIRVIQQFATAVGRLYENGTLEPNGDMWALWNMAVLQYGLVEENHESQREG